MIDIVVLWHESQYFQVYLSNFNLLRSVICDGALCGKISLNEN